MSYYTLEELIAMDDKALAKAAKDVFSMPFDPFSELGRRAMKKRLSELRWVKRSRHISVAVATIIGNPAVIMESILDYQMARSYPLDSSL